MVLLAYIYFFIKKFSKQQRCRKYTDAHCSHRLYQYMNTMQANTANGHMEGKYHEQGAEMTSIYDRITMLIQQSSYRSLFTYATRT